MIDYNKVKYLAIAINYVTKNVYYRQQLENQKEQLEAIMDNMSYIYF